MAYVSPRPRASFSPNFSGDSETVTQHPAHPDTQLLVESAPDADRIVTAGSATETIPDDAAGGEPPSLIAPPSGCRFHPRCPHAMKRCTVDVPPNIDISDAPGHWAACWLYDAATVQAEGRPELEVTR